MDNRTPTNSHTGNGLAQVTRLAEVVYELSHKGMDTYVVAKQLKNRGIELLSLRDEILEFYDTERLRIVEVFKEWKGSREFIQSMIKDRIENNDPEGRDKFIDLYKRYMDAVNKFDSKTFKKNRKSDGENPVIIEI
ncbi:MAG: hypothetical protein ACRBG0_26865 [Lewinella sp.]|uniref:hypothetical protein n=1 Tax=Lewinella sp. TaxID=2004506 RepID=UPI003D6BA434